MVDRGLSISVLILDTIETLLDGCSAVVLLVYGVDYTAANLFRDLQSLKQGLRPIFHGKGTQ